MRCVELTVSSCIYTLRPNTTDFSNQALLYILLISSDQRVATSFKLARTANQTQHCRRMSSFIARAVVNGATDVPNLPLVTSYDMHEKALAILSP